MDNNSGIEKLIITNTLNVVIGVIAPSTLYFLSKGKTYLNGPTKCVRLNKQNPLALTKGLMETGSLIEGTSDEVRRVINLLNTPASSRTTAHFTTTTTKCSTVIKNVAALTNSHILIVGCGGIGSTAALLLAGAGVKKFTLIDHDIVEKSNLNRQLFWRLKDIGKEKVATLKAVIQERFENTEIHCINQRLSYDKIQELMTNTNFHVAIVTADEPINLASKCGELARTTRTSIMSGGYLHSQCSANFFCAADNESKYELAPNSDKWQRLPASIMPSFGPTNFIIASLLSHGAIASITNKDSSPEKSTCIQWDSSTFPFKLKTYSWV